MRVFLLVAVLWPSRHLRVGRAPAHRSRLSSPDLAPLHLAVTTPVPRAQRFFDQGLRLLYAFNHPESLRAFREAARLDPGLAMAYWGQAMALGPNLNQPMTPENGRLAQEAIARALAAVARVDRAGARARPGTGGALLGRSSRRSHGARHAPTPRRCARWRRAIPEDPTC